VHVRGNIACYLRSTHQQCQLYIIFRTQPLVVIADYNVTIAWPTFITNNTVDENDRMDQKAYCNNLNHTVFPK